MKWVGGAKASFWLILKRRRAETEGGTVYLSSVPRLAAEIYW